MEQMNQNKQNYIYKLNQEKKDQLPFIDDPNNLKGVMNTFLGTIIHWTWADLEAMKYDPDTSSLYRVILGIINMCADGKVTAIRTVFDRIEGKVETPISIIKPKIYTRYPYAENGEELQAFLDHQAKAREANKGQTTRTKRKSNLNIQTASLSDVLKNMLLHSMDVPVKIIASKKATERAFRDNDFSALKTAPYVKSVVAASLLTNANIANDESAINVILERIEGKVEQTVKIVGEDIFIDNYSAKAPLGSELINGSWAYSNERSIDQWTNGFISQSRNKKLLDR